MRANHSGFLDGGCFFGSRQQIQKYRHGHIVCVSNNVLKDQASDWYSVCGNPEKFCNKQRNWTPNSAAADAATCCVCVQMLSNFCDTGWLETSRNKIYLIYLTVICLPVPMMIDKYRKNCSKNQEKKSLRYVIRFRKHCEYNTAPTFT